MKHKSWRHDKEKRKRWVEFMHNFYPQSDPLTFRLMDELRFVSRSLYDLGQQSVEDAGLSFAQVRVLMHLFFAEQMGDSAQLNPSEISERQGVSRNTMSSFIRNLEGEGMVERRLDPDDRRRFNISLTDRGRAIVHQHTRDHLQMIDNCFHVLNSQERETFLTLLHKLEAHLTELRYEEQK